MGRICFAWGLALVLLTGCATLSPQEKVDAVFGQNGFKRDLLAAAPFHLLSYSKLNHPGEDLVVYIEGDGAAYRASRAPSSDPTPQHPLVIRLAVLDSSANVAYLARPCQYEALRQDELCRENQYWTSARFSSEVIEAAGKALDLLKKKAGAQKIHLVGYSGGGAVAMLAARGRNDIASIRTIAGNLDHAEHSRIHHVSLLQNSLNPIDFTDELKTIPQIHYVGGKDKNVPREITDQFLEKLHSRCASEELVQGVSHDEGWTENWARLSRRIPACE